MPARGQYQTAETGWSPRGSVLAACARCAAEVRVHPSRVGARNYCTKECRDLSRSGPQNGRWTGGVPEALCQACGEGFTPKRRGEVAKYCSRRCHYQGRRKFATYQEMRREMSRRRDVRERAARALHGHHTEEEWQECLSRHGGKCVTCDTTENITRDHIVPVSKGGSDLIKNIQPMCHPCNASKGNRL